MTSPRRWMHRLLARDAAQDPAGSLRKLLAGLHGLQSHADRVAWLEQLGIWIAAERGADGETERTRLFVETLQVDTVSRELFLTELNALLVSTHAMRLFADTGLTAQFGVIGEAAERIIRRVLPAPPEPNNLAEVLRSMVPSADEARELTRLSPEVFADLVRLLTSDTMAPAWAHLRAEMADAVVTLAAGIATIGSSPDVLDRLDEGTRRAPPFLALVHHASALSTACASRAVPVELREQLLEATAACRSSVGQVVAHIESHGVSTHLVYRLEQMSALLDRLDLLAHVVTAPPEKRNRLVAALISSLGRAVHQDRSISVVLTSTMRQLSRKVVERTGEAGKHYLVHSRAGWWRILVAAAGGGALTVGTLALKFVIGDMDLPPFFAGLAASINYAGSFVLMQVLGFKLATKQPAMFAATLADSLLDTQNQTDHQRFSEEVARVTRSQTAAVLGNIGMAVPVAILFDFLWRVKTGQSFLEPETAVYAVRSLDPLSSGTILFAAITGVILMVSSVIGGWLENFAVYRRLPEAIAHHRGLVRMVGASAALRWSSGFMHSIAGYGTSIALGFALGMAPVVGAFFGLPLDVRHVTLSASQLALALSAMGPAFFLTKFAAISAAGVLIIGLLNFGVSFVLALLLAIRAREVSVPEAVRLLGATWRDFLRRPTRYLFAVNELRAPADTAPRAEVLAEHVATTSSDAITPWRSTGSGETPRE